MWPAVILARSHFHVPKVEDKLAQHYFPECLDDMDMKAFTFYFQRVVSF